ncbi:hypothetical protein QCA50_009738 [Cerrena zonata]|uniref:Uncharacterized protein n=1 Tax=Cerrena zonata TaxID=2478898 RepID=A0AAW0G0H5_9APHY
MVACPCARSLSVKLLRDLVLGSVDGDLDYRIAIAISFWSASSRISLSAQLTLSGTTRPRCSYGLQET